MIKNLVIVGGGVAGINAALSARNSDKEVAITIISLEYPYRKPSLPSLIAGKIDVKEILIYQDELLSKENIDLRIGWKCEKINREEKELIISSNNRREVIEFDSLIFASGGVPIRPRIPGVNLENVFTIWSLKDALKIKQKIQRAKRVVIVGAGFVGLEVAEKLRKIGLKPLIVEKMPRILWRLLEEDLSKIIEKRVEHFGVKLLRGRTVNEISGNGSVESVDIDGEKVKADLVILTAGVLANVDLARSVGVKIGRVGVLINGRAETNVEGIFAAGDVAEVPDLISGNHLYMPVGSIAAQTGKLAGVNAVGGKLEVKGFLRVQIQKVFGLEVGVAGHSIETAKEINIKAKTVSINFKKDFKGHIPIIEKFNPKMYIILDKKERVIGGQIVSAKYASSYLYGVIEAIRRKLTFGEFLEEWKSFTSIFPSFITNIVGT